MNNSFQKIIEIDTLEQLDNKSLDLTYRLKQIYNAIDYYEMTASLLKNEISNLDSLTQIAAYETSKLQNQIIDLKATLENPQNEPAKDCAQSQHTSTVNFFNFVPKHVTSPAVSVLPEITPPPIDEYSTEGASDNKTDKPEPGFIIKHSPKVLDKFQENLIISEQISQAGRMAYYLRSTKYFLLEQRTLAKQRLMQADYQNAKFRARVSALQAKIDSLHTAPQITTYHNKPVKRKLDSMNEQKTSNEYPVVKDRRLENYNNETPESAKYQAQHDSYVDYLQLFHRLQNLSGSNEKEISAFPNEYEYRS